MSKKKIFPDELVGEEIEVIKATNSSNLGMKGKVVDESKATLKIVSGKNEKILLKKTIMFKLKKTGQVIDGSLITKTPEERIKAK